MYWNHLDFAGSKILVGWVPTVRWWMFPLVDDIWMCILASKCAISFCKKHLCILHGWFIAGRTSSQNDFTSGLWSVIFQLVHMWFHFPILHLGWSSHVTGLKPPTITEATIYQWFGHGCIPIKHICFYNFIWKTSHMWFHFPIYTSDSVFKICEKTMRQQCI